MDAPRRPGRPRLYAQRPINVKVTEEQDADLRAIKERTGRELADLLREGVDHVRQIYLDDGTLTAAEQLRLAEQVEVNA